MVDEKLALAPKIREQLVKKKYGIVGEHSGVQICSWNKKSLRQESVCYKQKFYGIHTHRCAQMTPTVAWCTERCVFCWRSNEFYKVTDIKKNQVDTPQQIIPGILKERKRLLAGFKNHPKVPMERYEEGLIPTHFAISLSGEPTMYPYLPEMIQHLKEEHGARSIFVVTNGLQTEMIQRMLDENSLPTQLYLSLDAPNEELFKKVNKAVVPLAWKKLNDTIDLYPKLPCRRVVRFTLIKSINDAEDLFKDYGAIFERTHTDFLEIKAYMHLGYATKRLSHDNMPTHDEVKAFTHRVLAHLPNYEVCDESVPSRIVLLKRKDSTYTNRIYPDEDNTPAWVKNKKSMDEDGTDEFMP
ncbi:4-demethylwyosine synthase TYW1 [archaeon CG10_big_fil_rev_8_21_14_0_10_43_11]|nr:MAG: 4-demethylwyosine synthase TYW1 [archaeon CG10_big_fil_rev_8_21_14_0_10_43_11]